MNEIISYAPLLLIIVVAILATGIAGWKETSKSASDSRDHWGFYLWFTPTGYLILSLLFRGINYFNRPIVALIAILVYGLSISLLFAPKLPSGLKWHYPIGIAAIIAIFFI